MLATGQAAADGGGEERGQRRGAPQQAHEALGGQAPDGALGQRGQSGGAGLVAQQGQIAEDGRRVDDVQADAVGGAFEQAVAEDVQGIGARALGEDHLAAVRSGPLPGPRPGARDRLATSSENGAIAASSAAARTMAWRAPGGTATVDEHAG